MAQGDKRAAAEQELRELLQVVKRGRKPNLTLLYMELANWIDHLPPEVAGMDWLVTLDLEGTRVSDLGPIAPLVRLENLDLRGTPVSDLSPVAEMRDLRHLAIESTEVTDLSPLSGLTRLRELWLDGTPVEDLTPLQGCTALRHLNLRGTRVRDLTPLAKLPRLDFLDITQSRVEDLTPVLQFPCFLSDEGEAGISFDRTPAVAHDKALQRICAEVDDPERRAQDLVDHLTGGTRLTDWRGNA